MKDHWETLGNELHNFKGQLEELIEMLPQSNKFYQKITVLNKGWKKIQRACDDMDPFISPVKSVLVNSPLLVNADFKATWQFWKDYLNEQHGIVMRSRTELMALKRLMEISTEKPELAVKYLERAMAGGYKNFFEVKEVEEPAKPGAQQATGKLVVNVPVQYHQKTVEKYPITNNQ